MAPMIWSKDKRSLLFHKEMALRVEHGLNAVDASADQRVIALGTNNNMLLVRLWNGCKGVELEETHAIKSFDVGGQRLSLKPILKVLFNPTLALAHILATSTINGTVAIWNVEQYKGSGGPNWQPDNVFKEHVQAVDCMCWHFGNPQTLLSGSNDTKIKLWDLRVRARSTLTISPKSSYVRDVQFRKTEGSHRFAAAFGNGTVQVWDTRHPKAAETVFGAHDVAYTVDWNPVVDNLLATGGRDGLIKIWDLYQTSSSAAPASNLLTSTTNDDDDDDTIKTRRSKRKQHYPVQTIETIEKGVSRIRWRPEHPYQIASTSMRGHVIYIWNTMEPRVPLTYLNPCEKNDTLTDYLWLDQNLQVDDVVGSSLYGSTWWDTSYEEEAALDEEQKGSNLDDLDGMPGFVGDLMVQVGALPQLTKSRSSTPSNLSTGSKDKDTMSMSTLTFSGLAGSDMDPEVLARLKEQQRRRFKTYHHRYRNQEQARSSWGSILTCSKNGEVTLRVLQKAFKPLRKYKASSLSLSCESNIAFVHEKIPALRVEGALALNKTLKPEEIPPRSKNVINIFEPLPLEGLMQNQQHSVVKQTTASSLLGFDAAQFTFLAKAYVTPRALLENMQGTSDSDFTDKFRKLKSNKQIAMCCSHNAKAADTGGAPAIAQIWRLLKVLFVPESVDDHFDVTLGSFAHLGSKQQDHNQQHLQEQQQQKQLHQYQQNPFRMVVDETRKEGQATIISPIPSSPGSVGSLGGAQPSLSQGSTTSPKQQGGGGIGKPAHQRSASRSSLTPLVVSTPSSQTTSPMISPPRSPSSSISASSHLDEKKSRRGSKKIRIITDTSEDDGYDHDGIETYVVNTDADGKISMIAIDTINEDSAFLQPGPPMIAEENESIPGDELDELKAIKKKKNKGTKQQRRTSQVGFPSSSSEASNKDGGNEQLMIDAQRSSDEDSNHGEDEVKTSDTAGEGGGGEVGKQMENIGPETEETVPATSSELKQLEIVPLADPFPMNHDDNWLWLGSSLNLLCRLNRAQPLDEKQFNLKAPLLEQDRRELMDALALARPAPTMSPIPKGHQRLRKQQRMLRRRRFCEQYGLMYQQQLNEFSSLSMPSALIHGEAHEEGHENDDLLKKSPASPTSSQFSGMNTVTSAGNPFLDNSALISALAEYNTKMRLKMVHDILEYHAELGDVQTCAMIVLVLGDRLQPPVDQKRLRMWFCSYIDLLQQLQIFSVAARIISACEDEEVERCYKMTSMIALGCGSCAQSGPEQRKNVIRADDDFLGICGTCHSKISRCSICEQLVSGLYVWCQGCGHGGHLEHMEQWFAEQSECPTGCGHQCRF